MTLRTHLLAAALITACSTSWADLQDAKSTANAALAAGDYQAAVEAWQSVIEIAPEDGQSHFSLASAYMSLGQTEAARHHFERAAELGFQAMAVGYRLARLDASEGHDAAAVEQLQSIAEAGFPAPALIENEPDFAHLQGDPGFQAALAKIHQNRFPCKDRAESRAFDFWIGDWTVSSQGQPAGENRISKILGGCVLLEDWASASGQTGQSFNYWDASAQHWRQIWVDDTGGVLEYTGQIRDGSMVYEGVTHNAASGEDTYNRMTFTPNEDGSVRQLMEQSGDLGETWQVVFDGHYERKPDSLASNAIKR